MHELSIAQGILDIIRQYVRPEQAAAIRRVQVNLGRLSGVVPESLDFCFSAIVADTPLQAARLDIVRTATVACCNDCGGRFAIEDLVFLCGQCGSTSLRVVSGTDLKVVEIELDEEQSEVL